MYINYESAQNGWTEKDIRSLRVHSHRGQLFRNVLKPEFVLAKYAGGGKVDLIKFGSSLYSVHVRGKLRTSYRNQTFGGKRAWARYDCLVRVHPKVLKIGP